MGIKEEDESDLRDCDRDDSSPTSKLQIFLYQDKPTNSCVCISVYM